VDSIRHDLSLVERLNSAQAPRRVPTGRSRCFIGCR
jgi:hypothetical protein